MVIYPTLGGYVNYCKGFTLLDFPWANEALSSAISNPADTAPPGFIMFYKNLNLASTYFLAFLIFGMISLFLLIFRWYRRQKQLTDEEIFPDSGLPRTFTRAHQLQSYIYNIFVAGLAFSGFGCVLGILYNPTTEMTFSGLFYILGILIYAVVAYKAAHDFLRERT